MEIVADDMNISSAKDLATLVTIGQDYELRYWTKRLGVSEEELRIAVEQVGSSLDRVREQLGKAGACYGMQPATENSVV